MTEILFDLSLLAADLAAKMSEKKLSLREAAEEIGCSPATLGRMLKGNDAENNPDTKTLSKAASWVGKSISHYESGNQPKASSISDVEIHLRALPGLNERDKDALVAMVKAANDHYSSSRKRK